MKQLPLVLSILALTGVLLLGFAYISGDKKVAKKTPQVVMDAQGKPIIAPGAKVAYVDIDTLEANYDYFTQRKKEFEIRQQNIENELDKMAGTLRSEYERLQEKANNGSLSQSEGEAAQQKLMQKQQELETKRQQLGDKFLKDQESFNKEIHDRLHDIIAKYNEEKGYDFILSYAKDGSILFANEELDITLDIIEAMNREKSSTSK